MKTSRTGIIINTDNYTECVSFYKDVFALPIMFQQNSGDYPLTCFEFGGSYLMIETGGESNPMGKSMAEGSTKLRFNVDAIVGASHALKARGIEAEIRHYDWGSTIDIFDPDGNRIGIRDESTFARQTTGD